MSTGFFEIVESTRFTGDFAVKPSDDRALSNDETDYLKNVAYVLDKFADGEVDDADKADAAAAARRKLRESFAERFRKDAQEVATGGLSPETAAHDALVMWGVYRASLERLSGTLFTVTEKFEKGSQLASDLLVSVADALPEPNNVVPPDKQVLYVDLMSTYTTIKAVCQRMRDRAGRPWRHLLRKIGTEAEPQRADYLLDQYTRKLAGIGRLGLQGPHVQLASLALKGVRTDFVAQEAGRIKNSYVRSLGTAAGTAALVLIAAYWLFHGPFWNHYRVLSLTMAGAAIGAWLSFSIRRVTLSFDDLAVIEEDLLDPSLRIIFVISLTGTVALLFWTKAVNIEIGLLKTADLANEASPLIGPIALLVGLFCGIAERALATAISGRAATFVKGLGGGNEPR